MRRLDLLVVTHAQADHEGGAARSSRASARGCVLDGGAGWPTAVQRALPAALARAASARRRRAGQVLRVGALALARAVAAAARRPAAARRATPTTARSSPHCATGRFDLLLPADAESDVTAGLDLPRVDVLKVAHHGSADPGLPALLERTAPAVAAIEVGRGQHLRPPGAVDARGALRAVPQRLRTDRDGTVRAARAGERMRVERAG